VIIKPAMIGLAAILTCPTEGTSMWPTMYQTDNIQDLTQTDKENKYSKKKVTKKRMF